ncbi:hypothetical protein [Microbacterium sp. 18062]|uniref:hypothetical protein n=1 Tax=Microbacterium sp. 18062 TaxID=2681410 RepID=UPI00135C674C|nr:hypothetical protein [Microbacterium sp. 18062]
MTNQTPNVHRNRAGVVPWTGAVVALTGVLAIAVATLIRGGAEADDDMTEDAALGLAPSSVLLASILFLMTVVICMAPLLLVWFPQFRSPLTNGTAGQLRRFLDWFLIGLTLCTMAAYLGVTGLADSWDVSFTGAVCVGLGVLLVSIGIGYPRGGPNYDGPVSFIATVTKEFARSAPTQKYGTSTVGVALIATGSWVPGPVLLITTTVVLALLWLLPWIIALARTSRIEQDNRA